MTLTENVTQRMARDILGEAAVRLDKAGLSVMFLAHGELILAVDSDGSKEDAKAAVFSLITQAPEWAPDVPLAVEGDFAECYCK